LNTIANDTDRKTFFEEALVTAGSASFFPHLLGFIASLQEHFPTHPPLVIYSIDLSPWQKSLLRTIKNVVLEEIPPFVAHWRACYTWKLYVLKHAPAKRFFYLDASSRILAPLDEIFIKLRETGYFFVSQSSFGSTLKDIIPAELARRGGINIPDGDYFAAGAIGYQRGTTYERIFDIAYQYGEEGWTLGWSKAEQERSRGADATSVLRDCALFRHDQSVLNVAAIASGLPQELQSEERYCSFYYDDAGRQLIWNGRKGACSFNGIAEISLASSNILTKVFLRILLIIYSITITVISAPRRAFNYYHASHARSLYL
jgi:hypothetical protein